MYRLGQTCKLMLAAEDWQRLKDLGIRVAVRGCRAGKKETKQQSTSHIPTRVTQRPSADRVHKGRQHGRGVYKHVATVDSLTSTVSSRTLAAITSKQRSTIKRVLLNQCSVCNKTPVLQDSVTDHNIDLMVLTETWLKGDDRDNVILAELQSSGYTIKHKARQGRGGGVAIMHPNTLSVTRAEHSVSSPPQYASFEELQCLVHTVYEDSSAPTTWMVQRGHPSGEAVSPTGRVTVAEDTPHSTPRHVQREMQVGQRSDPGS